MKILFLHGWHSVPGGIKPTYIKDHGHEVINPALDDDDFEAAVKTAQSEFDKHHPQVVVGSSRGGAVAMNINSGNARLVLMCPAWKNWGTEKTARPSTVILHSRADDVIPFVDSEELVSNSGLPKSVLVEVGHDHRLADPESLELMLAACEAPSVHEQAAPVSTSERLTSIDVLRGFALLGILMVNMQAFGLSMMATLRPDISGSFTGINYVAWLAECFFFDQKMMSIFSMLFGAGLVMMTDRTTRQGNSPTTLYYRRNGILLLIGLIHAYLLWDGDILVSYALCGMMIYPLRKLRPRTLLIIGSLVMLPTIPLTMLLSTWCQSFREASIRVEDCQQRGEAVNDEDKELAEVWDQVRKALQPTSTELAETIKENRESSYWDLVVKNAPLTLVNQTLLFAYSGIWTIASRMIIGMALMKLGVFSATRSLQFYRNLALGGYGLGWSLVAFSTNRMIQNDFDLDSLIVVAMETNFSSILVALGHVAVVMLVYKARWFSWLTTRLAFVGRMALTNYLMQSFICTTFFNGYGLGYFGAFDRAQLDGLVVMVWLLQLCYSQIWLRHFQFGPAEWLWRSMTYGKIQPIWISRTNAGPE